MADLPRDPEVESTTTPIADRTHRFPGFEITDLPRYGAAVELLPASATRTPAWHQARAQGITATDVGALLGASSWDTPFSLYWRKKAGLHKVETSQMRRGAQLEDWVAERWIVDHPPEAGPINTWTWPGLLARDNARWQMATCDVLISPDDFDEPTTWFPLEVKTQGGSWRGWGPDWSDQVPPQYRYQVLWQCHVLGAPRGYLACLGPDLAIRTYVIEQVPLGEWMPLMEAVEDFHTRLEDGIPPELTGAGPDLDVLKQLYPDPAPEKAVTLDEHARAMVGIIALCRSEARRFEKEAKATEASLRQILGDAQIGTDTDGNQLVKRTVTTVAEHVRKASQRDTITITPGETTA